MIVIVYASIIEHLDTASRGLRCFITRDKDFASPDIENDLANYDCLRLPNFTNGLGYIRSQL